MHHFFVYANEQIVFNDLKFYQPLFFWSSLDRKFFQARVCVGGARRPTCSAPHQADSFTSCAKLKIILFGGSAQAALWWHFVRRNRTNVLEFVQVHFLYDSRCRCPYHISFCSAQDIQKKMEALVQKLLFKGVKISELWG